MSPFGKNQFLNKSSFEILFKWCWIQDKPKLLLKYSGITVAFEKKEEKTLSFLKFLSYFAKSLSFLTITAAILDFTPFADLNLHHERVDSF